MHLLSKIKVLIFLLKYKNAPMNEPNLYHLAAWHFSLYSPGTWTLPIFYWIQLLDYLSKKNHLAASSRSNITSSIAYHLMILLFLSKKSIWSWNLYRTHITLPKRLPRLWLCSTLGNSDLLASIKWAYFICL